MKKILTAISVLALSAQLFAGGIDNCAILAATQKQKDLKPFYTTLQELPLWKTALPLT